MSRSTRLTPTGLWLAVLAALCVIGGAARAQTSPFAPVADADPFADAVDLIQLGQIAVHDEGRIKSFDSFATQTMHRLSGPHRVDGRAPAFLYLDLIFRPERYEGRPIIYVKNKLIRGAVVTALEPAHGADPAFAPWAERFLESGPVSRELLLTPPVSARLTELGRDLIKTAKFVQAIEMAFGLAEPDQLVRGLRAVPPAEGDATTRWFSLLQIMDTQNQPTLPGLDPATRDKVNDLLRRLFNAWAAEDAAAVNAAANRLAAYLPAINPELYPVRNRLAWESWYFHMKNLTWVWLIYALALVPLMLSLVFRWPAARWVGLGMFLLAFGLQTFALLLRWYVAQRWPNTNMFEAVTTSTWFGGCAALILEILVRRTPMRSLFVLASATASMLAFMCAHYQPLVLDPNLSNRMPVLHDVWLYIHTNVIIFSYCLIFMAAVSALLYLLYRSFVRLRGRGGRDEYARVGGAGSLIELAPDGSTLITRARSSLGQVLDGTTMVLMELSFIMLWAGLVMGAIWADHSWGRPWGWDPKEVFALNTFIVFAILVHGRLKVADKGLWTACVALVGAAVMMFNWFTINFVIVSLHSYA